MADSAELSHNIEFIPNYSSIFKKNKCNYLTDFEYYLILTLAKSNNKELLYKLLKPVRIEPELGCWFRAEDWSVYSTINKIGAHRISYELFIGNIYKKEICHHCDRKGCVNPYHLFQDSHSSNVRDALLKGRIFKINPRSKSYVRDINSNR